MPLETRLFDPVEYLDTPDAVAEYLTAAFESGDNGVIADALGVVAKAVNSHPTATPFSRPIATPLVHGIWAYPCSA